MLTKAFMESKPITISEVVYLALEEEMDLAPIFNDLKKTSWYQKNQENITIIENKQIEL